MTDKPAAWTAPIPTSTVPLKLVVGTAGLAILALWAHNLLIPFWAPHEGLLANGRDFIIYRWGAATLAHGQPLYLGQEQDGGYFTYPPFAAALFLPFAGLPKGVGVDVWFAVTLLLLAWVLHRVLRLAGLRDDWRLKAFSLLFAVVLSDIEPVQQTLRWGQINILLMALVLLDLTRPEGSRGRGFGVGLAAGIKLTPLVFLPYLLITKQWRAAAWASGTFAATVVACWVLLPGDSAEYWFRAIRDTRRIADLDHPANQSINGSLIRLWLPDQRPGWLWVLLAAITAAAGLALARLAHNRGEETLAVILVGLTGCAVSPFSWGHHWVWFAPCIAWFAAQAWRSRGNERIWWGLAAVVLYAMTFMWHWRNPAEPRTIVGYPGLFLWYAEPGEHWYRQIVSSWYLIAYLGVLICAWLFLREQPPSATTDEVEPRTGAEVPSQA